MTGGSVPSVGRTGIKTHTTTGGQHQIPARTGAGNGSANHEATQLTARYGYDHRDTIHTSDQVNARGTGELLHGPAGYVLSVLAENSKFSVTMQMSDHPPQDLVPHVNALAKLSAALQHEHDAKAQQARANGTAEPDSTAESLMLMPYQPVPEILNGVHSLEAQAKIAARDSVPIQRLDQRDPSTLEAWQKSNSPSKELSASTTSIQTLPPPPGKSPVEVSGSNGLPIRGVSSNGKYYWLVRFTDANPKNQWLKINTDIGDVYLPANFENRWGPLSRAVNAETSRRAYGSFNDVEKMHREFLEGIAILVHELVEAHIEIPLKWKGSEQHMDVWDTLYNTLEKHKKARKQSLLEQTPTGAFHYAALDDAEPLTSPPTSAVHLTKTETRNRQA